MKTPRLPEFNGVSPLRSARFGDIALRANRFKEMTNWSKTVLNAEPLFKIPIGSFLTFDVDHHRVLIIEDPKVTRRDPKAVAH